MRTAELGEFGLIDRLRRKLARRGGVAMSIGDDAALLAPLASPVFTCDALVEGIHFRRDWISPRELGCKALTVNVSDIAAMGGLPVAALISIAIAPGIDVEFVDELYTGLEEAAADYGCTIAGGDTVRSPSALMLSIALIGNAPQPITRSGARPGDVVLATGTLGDSAAGLALLSRPELVVSAAVRDYLIRRHHVPIARLKEMGAALSILDMAGSPVVHAALDISDGLAGDAGHIAAQSHLGIEVEMASLPISEECRLAAVTVGADVFEWALRGGEDYELLLCVAPQAAQAVANAIYAASGVPATEIGRCTAAKPGVTLIYLDQKREAAPGGFSHF